ncbi:unnamed protein product [Mytilus coruscus]|uniref:C1q domain-containing protein n=1 Tax=Mytilus coruscus TaxID=42192 RepID=A0A6J8ENJ2_MYTCO|nr:unnamed protein product [Mytilus coruscus]
MDAYTTILVFILLALSGMAMSNFIHNPETVRGKMILHDIALLRKQVIVQSEELASQRKIIEKLENIVMKLVENNGIDITNMDEDIEINLKLKEKGFSRSGSFQHSSFEDAQVGFTAFLHSSVLVSSGNAIIFDFVMSNVGSAYSHHNGLFTTQQPGLYAFYIDIECVKHSKATYIEIVKDGTRIADTYCQGDDMYDNSGTMSVVHLNIGDAVWVRPYDIDGSFHLGGKSSFSGFLTGFVTERP